MATGIPRRTTAVDDSFVPADSALGAAIVFRSR